MVKLYVSLSTIPSRIKKINKCLDSLINQTKKPDCIYINIPYKYVRFQETILEEDLPKPTDTIQITRCEDYGPGTKLLGSYKLMDKDSLLVLVDDDLIYKNYMLETIYNAFIDNPENAYSFYTYHHYINIGCGADGFAMNTNILDKLDIYYQYIKDDSKLFYHDDFWISYYLHAKNINIVSLNNKIKPLDGTWIYNSYGNSDNGLVNLENNLSRASLQYYCEKYFDKNKEDIKNLI